MSLTGYLRHGATKAWIDERFPLVRVSARDATWRARAVPVQLPPPDLSLGLFGMAFDYRLRALLGHVAVEETVAREGARLLRPVSYRAAPPHACRRSCTRPHVVRDPIIDPAAMRAFFGYADEALAAASVVDGLRERDAARCCLLLGALETVFRTAEPLTELLTAALPVRSVEDMLAQVDDDWADEVTGLARQVPAALGAVAGDGPVVLNPVFAGSRDVGGADADLILGRTLVDVKARLSPEVTALDLYQVLGYVLLDYHDAFGLREVGIYLARQALTFRWTLDDLAGRHVGVPVLATLRREFRAFVTSDDAFAPRSIERMAPARGPRALPQPAREPSEAMLAWQAAMRAAVAARYAVHGPAVAYQVASAPTHVFWRRDPTILGARQAEADAAAAMLEASNEAADAAAREALRRKAAWQVEKRRGAAG